MTQPPSDHGTLLGEVRVTVEGMKGTVARLERTVEGDPAMGAPSLRNAIKSVADELNNETNSLCDRLDRLEQEALRTASRQEGVMLVVKWLGGSSLAALVGLVVMLIKAFSGAGP